MAPDKRLTRFVSFLLVLAASMPCESRFPKDSLPPCAKPSELYEVLLSNDGPTTLGGTTTFFARVQARHIQKPSKMHYRFCWEVPGFLKTTCINTFSKENKFHLDRWKFPGKILVKVTAYFNGEKDPGMTDIACVMNTTTTSVTDTINATLKASQESHSANQGVQLHVGPVKLDLTVHDPSHLFEMENITCWWHFGDGTSRNSTTMKHVSHNYTEDRNYYLSVDLIAWAKGRKYSGHAGLTLDISANLAPRLIIYGRPGAKLPNPRKDVVVLAVGVATFLVKFSDPYHLVKHVQSIWDFRLDGKKSIKINGSDDPIAYNFTSRSNYTLWVTSTLKTQHNKHSFAKSKNLLIQEPIKDLKLQHSLHAERRTIFNVSCQGRYVLENTMHARWPLRRLSGPISFCWSIAKNYCPLPVNKTCSLTLKREACRIVINHTFEDPGNYCLNLTAENEVSSAHTYVKVKISNDDTPTATSRTKPASIVLPIILCIIAVIVLAILLRKWMSYKKHPVERADFDFRDEDCRSISSVDLQTGQRCFPYRIFGRCSKSGERDYLMSSLGTAKYKSSGMYTELL